MNTTRTIVSFLLALLVYPNCVLVRASKPKEQQPSTPPKAKDVGEKTGGGEKPESNVTKLRARFGESVALKPAPVPPKIPLTVPKPLPKPSEQPEKPVTQPSTVSKPSSKVPEPIRLVKKEEVLVIKEDFKVKVAKAAEPLIKEFVAAVNEVLEYRRNLGLKVEDDAIKEIDSFARKFLEEKVRDEMPFFEEELLKAPLTAVSDVVEKSQEKVINALKAKMKEARDGFEAARRDFQEEAQLMEQQRREMEEQEQLEEEQVDLIYAAEKNACSKDAFINILRRIKAPESRQTAVEWAIQGLLQDNRIDCAKDILNALNKEEFRKDGLEDSAIQEMFEYGVKIGSENLVMLSLSKKRHAITPEVYAEALFRSGFKAETGALLKAVPGARWGARYGASTQTRAHEELFETWEDEPGKPMFFLLLREAGEEDLRAAQELVENLEKPGAWWWVGYFHSDRAKFPQIVQFINGEIASRKQVPKVPETSKPAPILPKPIVSKVKVLPSIPEEQPKVSKVPKPSLPPSKFPSGVPKQQPSLPPKAKVERGKPEERRGQAGVKGLAARFERPEVPKPTVPPPSGIQKQVPKISEPVKPVILHPSTIPKSPPKDVSEPVKRGPPPSVPKQQPTPILEFPKKAPHVPLPIPPGVQTLPQLKVSEPVKPVLPPSSGPKQPLQHVLVHEPPKATVPSSIPQSVPKQQPQPKVFPKAKAEAEKTKASGQKPGPGKCEGKDESFPRRGVLSNQHKQVFT